MGKFTDRVGMKYGELTVIKMERNHRNKVAWVCKCTCGNITKPIVGGNLTSGNTTRCNDHPFLIDLTGNRYGKLTVLGYSHTENKRVMWKVRCDCGVEKCYRSDMLQDKFKSCGCGWYEAHNAIEGNQYLDEDWYNNYLSMKARTLNPNHSAYLRYEELIQGVKIEPEWIIDAKAFHLHIGDKPSPTHSIDRIDNTKGYVYGNVRWATKLVQRHNSRKKRTVMLPEPIKTNLMNSYSGVNPATFIGKSAVVSFVDEFDTILYIAYTGEIGDYIRDVLTNTPANKMKIINECVKIKLIVCDSYEDSRLKAKSLITKYKPSCNSRNLNVKRPVEVTEDWVEYSPYEIHNELSA